MSHDQTKQSAYILKDHLRDQYIEDQYLGDQFFKPNGTQ